MKPTTVHRTPASAITNTLDPSSRLPPRSSTTSTRSYRQTSLFDFHPCEASSSSSSSPLPSSSQLAPFSALPTSPCAAHSSACEAEDDAMDLNDEDAFSVADTSSRKRSRRELESDSEEDESEDDRDAEPEVGRRRRSPQLIITRFNARAEGEGEPKIPSSFHMPGKQIGMFAMLQQRAIGMRVGPKQVSMRPYLRDLVSSNENEVFRCPSQMPYRSFAPPFALAFSRAAKAGGRQVFAVADEEGTIGLINGSEDSHWDGANNRKSFKAHHNAVFDLGWSEDDSVIATASGDQTVKLWDVETQACVGILAGHTCTIKSVQWDPFNPHMLATASRDGSIRIWDRRVQGADFESGVAGGSASSVATVNMIKNAHGTKGKGAKGRSATKSVTSVAYLQHSSNLLASSGSSESTIKVWDLRKSHKRRVNPDHYESNDDAVLETGTSRPHGISNMVLAPDGRKIFALSTDSRVYAFDPLNITYPAPLGTYSHPKVSCGSFYVRLALSPCSRYLATGSSEGGVYVWDTEGSGTDAVRLVGHEREVSGLDWGSETLATCSDDNLVRVWKFRHGESERARQEKDVRYRWSGEEDTRDEIRRYD